MIKMLITRDKARNCLSDLISTFIIGNVLWFTIYDNILYYISDQVVYSIYTAPHGGRY